MRGRRWIEFLLVLLLVGAVVRWQAQAPEDPKSHATTPAPARATPEPTPELWEPFSETARQGIVAAEGAATAEGSSEIDCRHLVMGLRQADPQIDAYLRARKVSLPKKQLSGGSNMAFAPEGKQAIEFAFEECRSEESNSIDAIYLFRGVLRTDSAATKSMAEAGVSLEDFKSWIKQRPDP